MIFPKPLKLNDKIAIISPASAVDNKYIDDAAVTLSQLGYTPVIARYAKGKSGSYSGTIDQRLGDLVEILSDDSIKGVLCSRGGYGVVHLLSSISDEFLRSHPKWIIGFSDISALHARMVSAGIVSIHAPMCKHLAECGKDDVCTQHLTAILSGIRPAYETAYHKYNRCGVASGTLVGGNMAVLCGLISTPVDLLRPDSVLFIEDIGESVYKIERMLYQLRLNGVLPSLKGLVVGQFTEYKRDDRNNEDMYDMIHRMTADYNYPITFDFPVGHVDYNLPLIEGAEVSFRVDTDKTTLKFL